MALWNRRRGPRLGTKLSFIALVLLAVPWLSYLQLVEMERLLLQGQQNAQLLVARGVAALFNERMELFDELPVQLEGYESLFAIPLYESIRIDGSLDEWDHTAAQNTRRFTHQGEVDGSFELTLGEQVNDLYGFVRVKDDIAVYRDLGNLNLATADHIRIEFTNAQGEVSRLALTYSGPGVGTGYLMEGDWRNPLDWTPLKDVLSYLVRVDDGFLIEFRLPIENMAHGRGFAVSFVDVDDPDSRLQRAVTIAQPDSEQTQFNLVVLRSIEAMNLIEGLGYVDTKVVVYDQQMRVRGESEAVLLESDEWNDADTVSGFDLVRPLIHLITFGETWRDLSQEESQELTQDAIQQALSGNPQAIRRLSESGSPLVLAAYPIQTQSEVLGAVTIEEDIQQILSFQQSGLRQIVFMSLLLIALVLLAAIGYAVRLAYRIRRLRRQAADAIDEFGRLSHISLDAEMEAGDEIGDLARSIDDMLTRLGEHNAFMERMPRTLRHEINNPLNTLSTSLENLSRTDTSEDRQNCIESAQRGVYRIGAIVQNLADASNLEDALKSEEREPVDLQNLLRSYVENLNRGKDDELFVFRGTEEPAFTLGSDIHIEQMMDKLTDNAIDFHRPHSPIIIQLEAFPRHLRITVGNRGPTLGTNAHLLFEQLVSHRSSKSTSHFGLGLYIVRLIAEYHGGTVHAVNLRDNSGVLVSVRLPRSTERMSLAA